MYRIGQFRRSQLNSYYTPLVLTISTQPTTTTGDIIFSDICGNLFGTENIMNEQNCYYLHFGVRKRSDSEQIFYLKLKNSSETDGDEQIIQEYKVEQGNGTVYFEAIISPNSTYNQIIWELQRTSIDYQTINIDDNYGRIMNIIDCTYAKLVDVLNFLKSNYTGMEYLTKIGIQGPPSLLMCINREPIRIGKTGIYEINNKSVQLRIEL